MHIHQSVVDLDSGQHFADADGSNSSLFLAYIGGLQTYLPAVMTLFAPNINSYRRLAKHEAAPINLQWGHGNRAVGFKVPFSEPQNRPVENRVPGADANPYLAFAASLACGYLGMLQGLKASTPMEGDAYNLPFELPFELPRDLHTALNHLTGYEPLFSLLGARFLNAYRMVKEKDYETFFRVISSWEREHLLLNV